MPDKVGSVSGAAKSLCMWVRAMELYGQIFRVVQPKKERYNQAMSLLKEKQEALADAKRKLDEVPILYHLYIIFSMIFNDSLSFTYENRSKSKLMILKSNTTKRWPNATS